MKELIDSTIVGAALCLALFVGEKEESTQRQYKFFASGVLQNTLDKINWNEFWANFNEFMKCFRNPIQLRTFEDGDSGLFDRDLQFLNKVELERLAMLIIQQQIMNTELDPLLHPPGVMRYYFPPCPTQVRYK